jgi:hypothetical protein
MRLIFTALFLLLAAFPVVAQERLISEFETRFAERNARTLALLQAEFPEDHAALLQRLEVIGATRQSLAEKFSAGFDAVGVLRRKYAERLRFAPGEALSGLLVQTALFHDAVHAGEGAIACGVFAKNGTGALYLRGVSARYATHIDAQSTMFFAAVAAAVEDPQDYGQNSPNDLTSLLTTMAEAGMPRAYAEAIASGNPANRNLCPALSTMFRAAAVYSAPEGLRVRADLAQNLEGY